MELALHHELCVMRLRRVEARSMSNLFSQLDLMLEQYLQQISADADPLFAGLDLGGSETAPADPALAMLFPDAAADPEYAKFMRMTQERGLLLQHRADLAMIIGELNGMLYSDEQLAADVQQLRSDAFLFLQDELQQDSTDADSAFDEAELYENWSEDAADLAENLELEQTLREIQENAGEVDLDNPDFEADERVKKQLQQLIAKTHPYTLEFDAVGAARWARITNLVRLSVASRVISETGMSPLRAAEAGELAADHAAVLDWLTIFVDGLSTAVVFLSED